MEKPFTTARAEGQMISLIATSSTILVKLKAYDRAYKYPDTCLFFKKMRFNYTIIDKSKPAT